MPLIQKNCIQCHGPSSAKNWTNYNVFVSEKNLILVRVLGPAANMPLGAKLSASDKQLLQTWIDTGMAYAPPVGPNPGPTPVPGPGPAPQPNPGPGPNPAPGPQPGPTPEPVPQPDPNTPAQVQNCLGCHGDKGQSVVPNFPQLAAQNSMYLSNQLTAFANHTRADADAQTFMWPVASTLSPDDIKVIALYFSSQAPGAPQPAGDPQKIAAGKLLYESGIPTNNVPACLACHGTGAVGRQNFPRLAGQFKDYLTKQLNAFKDGSRADETTMPSFSKKLTDEQIDNLTEYLQSL
jgi:cytochrome c553